MDAATTALWRAWSPAGPMVRPIRCGVISERGTPSSIILWRNARTPTVTVGIPAESSALATSPTDPWQTGQVATSNATSTSRAAMCSAHSGATCFSSLRWEVAPVKA